MPPPPAQKKDPLPVTTPGVAGPVLAWFDSVSDIAGTGNLKWDEINSILALNGKLGIGLTSPATPLDVVGAIQSSTTVKAVTRLISPILSPISDAAAGISFNKADGTTNVAVIDTTNGRIGIGTASPSQALDVATIAHINDLRVPTIRPVTDSTAAILFTDVDGSHACLWLDTTNIRMGINASFPAHTLDVGGQGYFSTGAVVFQTAALTAGSVGSLVIPVNEGSTVALLTDALAGNLDGCIGGLYDSTGALYKIGIRLNGLWKHVAVAGFSIPNYSKQKGTDGTVGVDETICPLCDQQMKPGQGLGMLADKWDNNHDSQAGLHTVAAHLKCLNKLD